MFKRLRNKFLILNISIISVVMFIAFTVVYMTTAVRIHDENSERLEKTSANAPAQEINQSPILGVWEHSENTREYSLSFFLLIDENGSLVDQLSYFDLSQDEVILSEAVNTVVKGKQEYGEVEYASFSDRTWIYKTVLLTGPTTFMPNGVIRKVTYTRAVFLDVSDSKSFLGHLLIVFLILGAIMLFVIMGISLFFANRAVAPVELSFDKQRQFIADASHELKTPIAVISANADALLANKTDTVESQKKWVEYILAETDRMGKLVNDLLELAKTDAGTRKEDRLPFNISDEALNAALAMEVVAFEKGISIKQDIALGIFALGNNEKIRQVIAILLDNAIKYAGEKGKVAIRLSEGRHDVTLVVANTGVGIPKEMLPKIFDRFYRADPSREHTSGGYGLGLAIAKAVVEHMGGKIIAQSTPGKITTFTIKLNKREKIR